MGWMDRSREEDSGRGVRLEFLAEVEAEIIIFSIFYRRVDYEDCSSLEQEWGQLESFE